MPHKTLAYPIDVYQLHRQQTELFPFLLESVAENPKIGRYDILFSQPQQVITLSQFDETDFLGDFNRLWQTHQSDEDLSIAQEIPFRGGWFVFFAYEFAQHIEPTLSLTTPPYPIAYAAKCGAAIVVDKIKQQTHLVGDLSEPNAIDFLAKAINAIQPATQPSAFAVDVHEDATMQFLNGVKQSRQYIIAGDVFQVNLSRGWQFSLPTNGLDGLYANLRRANPAPFACSCHFEHFSVLSSSPERLISIRHGNIETRPIAGTRRRGDNEADDKALSQALIGHFKERAEHIMLIDLERNDLGRICQAGTVQVDEMMVIESYAHVHHIVSNVIGKLRENITPADAIRAVFPGGTITGCPKVRCMEIIHELEQTYRGAYTGSLGYINHNGDMDSNILIRTFTHHNGQVQFRAGAGLVYDSIAKDELQETRNKAAGLLKAL